jgi:acyl-[acyl-carrier-protein]-phospholipid O-acyltransferase/long-chain-fatty-acid--[acyl-carrier-protein] ligase
VNFAIGLTDRVPVFLNFTASSDALDYAIDKCQIKQIYTSRKFIGILELEPRDEFVYLEYVMKTVALPNKLYGVFAALLLPSYIARRIYFPKTASSVHNTATVLFSSGSTGTPKGVVLTHHNFSSNLNGVVRILGMDRDEVILGSLPFFHSFGYMATMWLPLYWGVSVVYHPNPMDAETIGKLVDEHKVGILFATPTFLQAYTRKCTPEQMKSLKLVITGAEKLRQKVSDRFAEKFDCVPIEGYGCTELSPVVSINLPKSLKDAGKAVGKVGAIGQAIPGIVTKTVDPDSGELCDVDDEGLLLVKGPNVLKEYLGEPEKTAEALKDGWYNTGDIAKIDADGYMYITGRLSRFSKIGGEMVPHGALEDEIHAILNVTETTVVVSSVDDAAKGERLVILHLEITITPQDIIKELQEKGLPNLWIPKANSFVQIESIPVLGTGKLDLKAVKDIALDSKN